jgi:hypothetical protein
MSADIAPIEVADPMNHDAVGIGSRPPRNCDMDRLALMRGDDAAALSRCPEAQDRIGAAGEDAGEPAPLAADPAVSDCINAAEKLVKMAVSGPAVDRRRSHADLAKLATGDDSMLPPADLCDQARHWA